MNEADIERFRHKLALLRTELHPLDELPEEAATRGELDDVVFGGLSRKEAMQAQLTTLMEAGRRRRQLDKIEGAFRRIGSGAYGNCFVCGEEIETRRLSEDPTNTRCIKCAD